MTTEIETTFMGVAHDVVRQKLRGIGATLTAPERLMQRTVFDYPDLRLDKRAAWIRLRNEGEIVTLTYKQRLSEHIDGMKEVEIIVDDYEKTKELLIAIGLFVKAEQETKRESWKVGDVVVTLDTWPWLDPFTEIEGPTEESVRATSDRLGFDWSTAIFDSNDKLYQLVFDVTRTEISTCPIRFGPVPDWLEALRRTS